MRDDVEACIQAMNESLPRKTKMIWLALQELIQDASASSEGILLVDVAVALRNQDTPMGAWQVRGELTRLEALGLVRFDSETGLWHVHDSKPQRESAAGRS